MRMKQVKIEPDKLFSPYRAIRLENQDYFRGRADFFNRSLRAINKPSSSVIIYGERGVGKTSFGYQLINIIEQKSTLLSRYGISYPNFKKDIKCIWIQCSRGFKDLEGLVKQLLLSDDEKSLINTFPKAFKRGFRVKEIKDSGEAGVKLFGIQAKIKAEETLSRDDVLSGVTPELMNHFNAVLKKIKRLYDNTEIMFFVDEFDRLPDKTGIGDFIKSVNDARFVIIGIADNISEIVVDHKSAGRKIEGNKIKLKGLKDSEIDEIFNRAENVSDNRVVIEQSFRNQIFKDCGGYPWFVQLLGYHALDHRQDLTSEKIIITEIDYYEAINDILSIDHNEIKEYQEFAEQDDERFQLIYNQVNNDSKKREILFVLCAMKTGWITEDELEYELSEKAMNLLEKNLNEFELFHIIKRSNKSLKFIDPLMRIIVRMIKSYYDKRDDK